MQADCEWAAGSAEAGAIAQPQVAIMASTAQQRACTTTGAPSLAPAPRHAPPALARAAAPPPMTPFCCSVWMLRSMYGNMIGRPWLSPEALALEPPARTCEVGSLGRGGAAGR